MLDAAQIKETLEKKFNVTQGGLELDNDLCRKNAITNITQNLAQQLQLHLNSANLQSNSKSLSESNARGNIIRMASESSKPSTPLTEIPTKSVIQPTTDISEEQQQQQEENKTRSPDIISHAASSTGVVPVQRSSVVRAIENGDIIQKNDTSPDMLTPEGVSSNERRLSKSVISDQMINETDNPQAQVGDLPANTETAQTNATPSAIFTNTRLVPLFVPFLCLFCA